MSKYIDVDNLIAEIEKRQEERQDIRDTASWENEYWPEGEFCTRDDEDDAILSIITSLQQEQSVDKNILTWRDVNEIERIINKVHYEFPHGIGEEAFGKLVLERFIDGKDDLQEQPEKSIEINGIKYKEVPAKTNDKICKDCDYFLDNGSCCLDACPCTCDDNILERFH